MGLRVLGVGAGVFIIALVWFLSILFSLIFVRVNRAFSLFFTALAAVFTAILVAVPLDGSRPIQTSDITQITDSFFFVRVTILVAMSICTLLGAGLLFYTTVLQQRQIVQFTNKHQPIEELH